MTGPLWNDWGRNSVVLRLSMLGDRRLLRLPMMGGRRLLLGLMKAHWAQLNLVQTNSLRVHWGSMNTRFLMLLRYPLRNLIAGSHRLQMVPRHHALGLGYTGFRGYGLEPLLDAGLLAGGVGPWRR